jgi:hypothetical protein
VSTPVPLTSPPKVRVSERLKMKVPVSVTLPVMLPAVPPAPICSVFPALIVVPPV